MYTYIQIYITYMPMCIYIYICMYVRVHNLYNFAEYIYIYTYVYTHTAKIKICCCNALDSHSIAVRPIKGRKDRNAQRSQRSMSNGSWWYPKVAGWLTLW